MPRRFATSIVLPGSPTLALEAAPKQYVDNRFGGGYEVGYVPAGSTTPTITHALNTTDATCTVIEVSTGLTIPIPCEALTTTSVRLTFNTAPTTNQYRYLILGAGSGSGVGVGAHNHVVPVAQLVASAAQTVTNNTWTALAFGSESIDSHNGHDNVTNNSRWTCPTNWTGTYLVSGIVSWAGGSTGVRAAAIAKNGNRINGTQSRYKPVGDTDGYPTGDVFVPLVPTDYVELHVIHTQGTNLDTFVGAPAACALSVGFYSG